MVNRLANDLRLGAYGVGRSDSDLDDYGRRMTAKLGKVQGITATALKLSRLICEMIQSKQPYEESLAFQPQPSAKTHRLKKLRMLQQLGRQLTDNLPEAADFFGSRSPLHEHAKKIPQNVTPESVAVFEWCRRMICCWSPPFWE